MSKKGATPHIATIMILLSSITWGVAKCDSQQNKKPFTVADEIGLRLFTDPNGGSSEVHFSPDGNYFVVWSERGRLDLNLVEDSLRFYRSQDVENFLEHSSMPQTPSPVWIVNRSDKEGPVISNWRWLADSSGVAFLEGGGYHNRRLILADLRKRTLEPLTSETESVKTFDINDRRHYVYTAVERKKPEEERRVAAIVGTGRPLYELIFSADPVYRTWSDHSNKNLWAITDGRRFKVKHGTAPLIPEGDLTLSPDGRSLVATLPVPEVPASWPTLYPPPFPSIPYNHLHVGRHDVHQYVLIGLQAGSVRALTDAPVSVAAGWESYGSPSWSADGEEILLPGTFIESKEKVPSRPCVAVVDLRSDTRTCVEMLKAYTEHGWKEGDNWVSSQRFASGDKERVLVSTYDRHDWSLQTTEYRRTAAGAWQVVGHYKGERNVGREGLEVTVEQGFDKPPLLIGTNKGATRVIWNPNPQFKNFDLGQPTVYTWKTKDGQELKAGLFKPNDYKQGQHYPLVIQTHGFTESEFRPSGVFPTAFAARELAAVGIVVLQVQEQDCPGQPEGPCQVSEYEAAVNQLVSDGLVDAEKVGIIGFSRTCFYVMETLTTGSLRLKAASITDGVMGGYFEYTLAADLRVADEYNSLFGAAPFGEGLQQWLKRSPGFNLDKIGTPLLVVGGGPYSLLNMWQPYAGLRYLKKPVDVVMLNTREHVLTNPAVRMASQGGSVDWFRFWLQDYEDPDPAKKEQYERWRGLRKLQEENDKKAAEHNASVP